MEKEKSKITSVPLYLTTTNTLLQHCIKQAAKNGYKNPQDYINYLISKDYTENNITLS